MLFKVTNIRRKLKVLDKNEGLLLLKKVIKQYKRFLPTLILVLFVAIIASSWILNAKIEVHHKPMDKTITFHNRERYELGSNNGLDIVTMNKRKTTQVVSYQSNNSNQLISVVNITAHSQLVRRVAWNPSGTLIASASYDNTVKIWNITTTSAVVTLNYTDSVTGIDWSPDGSFLAVGSGSGRVDLWNTTSWVLALTLPTSITSYIFYVDFSPDSQWIAIAGYDSNIAEIYNTLNGNLIYKFNAQNRVDVVKWDFTGQYLLISENNGSAHVVNPFNGTILQSWDAHTSVINEFDWKPNDNVFVSVSHDAHLQLWDWPSLTLIKSFTFNNGIWTVSWHPVENIIATGQSFGNITIINATNNNLIDSLDVGSTVFDVEWAPSGQNLAAAREDGVISIFRWNSSMHYIKQPTITYPNGGETLSGLVNITWQAATDSWGHPVTYDLYYSTDDGLSWSLLVANVTSTSYQWNTTAFSDGTAYLIKIVAMGSQGLSTEDVSDGTFSVLNTAHYLSVPVVVYPNGGETLSGLVNITWQAATDSWRHPVTYDLYYSQDGGTTWNILVSGLITTSYQWDTTVFPDGYLYLIKVVAKDNYNLESEDTSDTTFTVQNMVQSSAITSSATSTPVPVTISVNTPSFSIISSIFVLSALSIFPIRQSKRKDSHR